jgi:formylmethanofuran dehydrogenase subunit E
LKGAEIERLEESSRPKVPLRKEKNMAERNLFLLKAALIIKLGKLGLDSAICHKCGKIISTTNENSLCKDCLE